MALQLPGCFLVFQDNGVSTHLLSADPYVIPQGTWALSGSYDQIMGKHPCDAFLDAAQRKLAWVIQITSPLEENFKDWKTQHYAEMFVMDYVLLSEITALGLVQTWLPKCFFLAKPFLTATYLVSTPVISNIIMKSGDLPHKPACYYHKNPVWKLSIVWPSHKLQDSLSSILMLLI